MSDVNDHARQHAQRVQRQGGLVLEVQTVDVEMFKHELRHQLAFPP
eukprot:CAMPEP_0202358538 /NCGR_PEP_ID=MMETSP1126-20121109/12170_1 /ASSEMBLY_ACC=CAM_ASM_000457 /TAXON_ID=3047 /ORGANISM="Dunaliella tertiolecta, Strain CCMP1320" /LENGTH=45 /DNA_ID= /DNA_START= /DNA_END= /DNA_ORIENTATION=